MEKYQDQLRINVFSSKILEVNENGFIEWITKRKTSIFIGPKWIISIKLLGRVDCERRHPEVHAQHWTWKIPWQTWECCRRFWDKSVSTLSLLYLSLPPSFLTSFPCPGMESLCSGENCFKCVHNRGFWGQRWTHFSSQIQMEACGKHMMKHANYSQLM